MPVTIDRTARIERALQRAVAVLRASVKFQEWRKQPWDGVKLQMVTERHFKPEELAEMWQVSTETIRCIFREEEGVLKIGKAGGKYERGYITLRIPEKVAERAHKRLSA